MGIRKQESWEKGVYPGCPGPVSLSLSRPFRPRPPQQPTTEGGDGETKPNQGPTDGSRPEPQRPRNRPYFQRRRQQPPGPRQPIAAEVRVLVAQVQLPSFLPFSFASNFSPFEPLLSLSLFFLPACLAHPWQALYSPGNPSTGNQVQVSLKGCPTPIPSCWECDLWELVGRYEKRKVREKWKVGCNKS